MLKTFPKFPANLRAARKDYRYSLDRLAEESGISKTYLWELENGKALSPSVGVVYHLAEILNVAPDQLLGV